MSTTHLLNNNKNMIADSHLVSDPSQPSQSALQQEHANTRKAYSKPKQPAANKHLSIKQQQQQTIRPLSASQPVSSAPRFSPPPNHLFSARPVADPFDSIRSGAHGRSAGAGARSHLPQAEAHPHRGAWMRAPATRIRTATEPREGEATGVRSGSCDR